MRAFDTVLQLPGGQVAIEFVTRLADAQAQFRAMHLKKRDAHVDRLVVVVQGTRTNRRALAQAGQVLLDLPGKSQVLLRALVAADLPTADGVIVF
jgi:hypothetical protein